MIYMIIITMMNIIARINIEIITHSAS
jgi:hypothetical protein